jgi:hypothetical protein
MRIWIWDLGIFLTLDPGSWMEKFGSGIRDKHPGSATLQPRFPVDPALNETWVDLPKRPL